MKRVAMTPTDGQGSMRKSAVARKRGVFDLQGHFLECGVKVRDICDRLTEEADPKTLGMAARLMQRQIVLEARVLETAVRAQAIMEFQSAVLEALEGAGIQVQRRIIGMFEANG
jgi:hypothetical protein